MELKKIAILGPGGNVGKAIITELLKDPPRFTITAITRQTSTYTAPPNTSIAHKTVDYTSLESLKDAFHGHDAIVNCITGGATQYEPSKLIIDAAIFAGVKFFFANEFVGHATSERFKSLPESFAGAKYRIREYLEELGKASKITRTSLNGGPFFDMWLTKGPAGFSIPTKEARIYGTGNNPLYWTPLPTIALAAANMLRNPQPILNRPIYVYPFINAEPKPTQNALLHALESVVDAKFTVEHIDVAKIDRNAMIILGREKEGQVVAGGQRGNALKGLNISNQFYEAVRANDFTQLVENETVGVQDMTVEEAVRDAVERYGRDCKVVEGMFRVDACVV
ncbi:hypothetical protein PTNB73_04070 [Pyrenophora teres f. teres]|nr:hypothetical protein PTNB85_05257 [Pyrenophora teres f. teres]KAE8869017.1 hypothetical protein PTNB73_04070 [Pyrenophora teres f. teres]